MIYGGLICLTIIGAIFGIPCLLAGYAHYKGGEEATLYNSTGDVQYAIRSAQEFVRYSRIYGILILVIFIVYLIAIIFMIALGLLGHLGNV